MTSMCPTDVGEDITNWLLNIRKPCHIKVKEFVTHIKEINRFLPFLPPPFNSSLTQEELFAIIKKSIPSFERLFRTNNVRTTVTTLNQLETYYMDLEEVNPPSNNQPHGYKTIVLTTDLQTIIMDACQITTNIINKIHLTTKM